MPTSVFARRAWRNWYESGTAAKAGGRRRGEGCSSAEQGRDRSVDVLVVREAVGGDDTAHRSFDLDRVRRAGAPGVRRELVLRVQTATPPAQMPRGMPTRTIRQGVASGNGARGAARGRYTIVLHGPTAELGRMD
jgi:hypothetical protein